RPVPPDRGSAAGRSSRHSRSAPAGSVRWGRHSPETRDRSAFAGYLPATAAGRSGPAAPSASTPPGARRAAAGQGTVGQRINSRLIEARSLPARTGPHPLPPLPILGEGVIQILPLPPSLGEGGWGDEGLVESARADSVLFQLRICLLCHRTVVVTVLRRQ